jgi:hypothetical protein
MRIDAGSQMVHHKVKLKEFMKLLLDFMKVLVLRLVQILNNMERIPFRSSANAMDSGIMYLLEIKK